MWAALGFFEGRRGGEGLPYLAEFLLCTEYGWSWQQLQETPAGVLAYWLLYRSISVQVANARAADGG